MLATWGTSTGFNPASLFAGGVQGAWYDPSDNTTMFQDSAGTTPVTAVEQAVGLILDKSKGLVRGADLIVNGTFATDTSWTKDVGWTIGGGAASVTTGGIELASIGQSVATKVTAGRTYEFSLDVTAVSAGSVFVRFLADGSSAVVSPNFSTTGTKTGVLVAPSWTSTLLIEIRANLNSTATVDNFVLRELAGNHAFQSTSASRPTLRARYNLALGTEAIGGANWTNYASAPTMTSATDPLGGLTATTLDDTNGAGFSGRTQNFTVISGSYSISVYAKAGTADGFSVWAIGSVDGTLIQDSLTWTGSVPVGSGWTAIDVGSGYYRVSKSFTTTSASQTLNIYLLPCRSLPSLTGSTTFWGADVRRSCDTNLPYQRVNSSTDYATGPQFPQYLAFDGTDDSLLTSSVDFATVTSDGQARRNLLNNPTQFDAAGWTKTDATVVANAGTAPDGTVTADLIYPTTTGTIRGAYQAFTASATTYTGSLYVKAAGKTAIRLVEFPGSLTAASVDLTTGAVSGVLAGYTVTTVDAQNGWWRVIYTASATAGTRYVQFMVTDNVSTSTATTNGTDGALFWGAQLETGSTATAFQNIGTDKMTVWGGVTKLSDALGNILTELTASGFVTQGGFYLSAPNGNGLANYGFVTQGSFFATTTYAAPITNVLTCSYDLSASTRETEIIPRINGILNQTGGFGTGTATGNFANAPLYIGRRNNASLPFNGRIYSLIVRGAQSNSTQIAQTERYVASKTPLGVVP